MQFGRRWQLQIFSDTDVIVIDNLRVAFDISKTISNTPNPAKIKIWNLSRSNVNKILNNEFKNVALAVGYQSLNLIFTGDIVKSNVTRSGVDFVIDFECADGFRAYTESRINISLNAGSSDTDVLNAVLKTLKNVQLGQTEIINKTKLPRGRVLEGDSRNLLNGIAMNNDADWSIQDGQLIFLPKKSVLSDEIVVLSQQTGLINSPQKTDSGLELDCLLNPNLKIGGLVRVQSMIDYYNGDYKIVAMKHSGDGLSGDWKTSLTAVGGKFQAVKKSG